MEGVKKALRFGTVLIIVLACSETKLPVSVQMRYHCSEVVYVSEQSLLELGDVYIYDGFHIPYGTGTTCNVTIKSGNPSYNKLMFYFESFDLKCKDGHLEFLSGYSRHSNGGDMSAFWNRVKGLEADVCGDVIPLGVFTVGLQNLRIIYVPEKSRVKEDVFAIVITAYSDDYCPSKSFKCDNSRCINEDDACGKYDSCGDGSGCKQDVGYIVGVVIGVIVGLAIVIGVVIFCICRCMKSGENVDRLEDPDFSGHGFHQSGFERPYSTNIGSRGVNSRPIRLAGVNSRDINSIDRNLRNISPPEDEHTPVANVTDISAHMNSTYIHSRDMDDAVGTGTEVISRDRNANEHDRISQGTDLPPAYIDLPPPYEDLPPSYADLASSNAKPPS